MNKPMHDEPRNEADPPNLSRRRFARGVAAPVVLGSLASQPVLGQTPYHCTVSGNLSDNTSYRVGEGVACETLGADPSSWAGRTDWPTGYTRGSPPRRQGNNACTYDSSTIQGTVFNAKGFVNVFWQHSSGMGSNAVCNVAYSELVDTAPVGSVNPTSATMLQVLSNATRSADFEFAAIAIASLLSAESSAYPLYPLTPKQVVQMYNAARGGGLYFPTSGSAHGWDRDTVAGYLSSLMPFEPRYFKRMMP